MFPVFPCKADKTPLIDDWQNRATTDPIVHQQWVDLFGGVLRWWGIPCGPKTGILALDVDVKTNGFASLSDKMIPATMWQDTQSGGRHYVFKYPQDGSHYGNRVGFLQGLDSRGLGGYIVHYGLHTEMGLADAPEWFRQSITRQEYVHDPTLSIKLAPDIARAIIEKSLEDIREAPPGESNNILNREAFKLGQLVSSESISRIEAEMVLLEAAKQRGKPIREALATIKSGLDGGSTKPMTSPFPNSQPIPVVDIPVITAPARWTPQRLTREDLLNKVHLRRPQLFRDWSTQDISITTADGGTGKTTLKLGEAISLALGDRFLGFDCVSPGKTLFITGEDTDKKLAAMLGAIINQMGLFEELPGNEEKIQTILNSIVIKKDSDLCIVAKDRQGFITPNPDALNKIMHAITDLGPFKMIVLDPISSFWGAESALNDMSRAVAKFASELVDKSGACVEIINHMGKQSSQLKDMSQFAGRGGTGLPSHARVSRVLRGLSVEEYIEMTGEDLGPDRTAMLCNVNKFSDGSPLYNKPFVIVRDGYLFQRKALTEAKILQAEKELSDTSRIFKFIKEERMTGKYPTQKAVEAYFMINEKMTKARVDRALNMLTYSGFEGENLKLVENPDALSRERVFVVTDPETGKEL